MVGKLLRLLPPHKQYDEPFFGAGALFFAKEPCPHETINDIDEAVTTFFRVLRDRGDEFMRLASLTEYNEALWREARDTWHEEQDEVRRACKWFLFVRARMSGDIAGGFSRTRTKTAAGVPASLHGWLAAVDRLPEVVERLRGTQILCRDWWKAVQATDTPDCLHYLDPPYPPDVRRSGGYRYEMTTEDHRALVERIQTVEGMVMLSGYPTELYRPLEEAGWIRYDFPTACDAVGRTRATGILGKGAALQKQSRIECVWLSPNAQARLCHRTLLGDEE